MTPDLKALAAPTPPTEVKQRMGPGGKKLDYVDARFVADRLDATIGPENWQDRYILHPSGSVECGLGIKVDGIEWVWKHDVGDQSDIEPTKGAYSDAFKRAAVKWGIGRDLYGDHAGPSRTPSAPRSTPERTTAPVRPVTPSELTDDQWEGLTTVPAPAASVIPTCPRGHGPMNLIPAGVSKRTNRAYAAFYGCHERDCNERRDA